MAAQKPKYVRTVSAATAAFDRRGSAGSVAAQIQPKNHQQQPSQHHHHHQHHHSNHFHASGADLPGRVTTFATQLEVLREMHEAELAAAREDHTREMAHLRSLSINTVGATASIARTLSRVESHTSAGAGRLHIDNGTADMQTEQVSGRESYDHFIEEEDDNEDGDDSVDIRNVLKLRPEWAEPTNLHLKPMIRERSLTTVLKARLTRRSEEDEDEDAEKVPLWMKIKSRIGLIPPNNNYRLCWDVLGAVLIGYDSVAIPLEVSFKPKDSHFLSAMEIVTLLFWTCDIVATFLTGYYHKGGIVMSPKRVAKKYMTTWFIIDFVIVFADWFSNVGDSDTTGSSDGISSFARSLRAIRTIRVLRLVRLLKLQRLLSEMQDRIDSEYTYLLVNLVKLLVFILVLNHCIACLWFWISLQSRNLGEDNWVDENNMLERSIGYRYTTSLHWTLTQFTPASMEVMPENIYERSMAVVVLLFSLVAFSSFLASISASMTALRNMNGEMDKQFWTLRRFLKQQQVSRAANLRIVRFLEFVCREAQGRVQRQHVRILQYLSAGLVEELNYELAQPKLSGHPLFKYFMVEMSALMSQLCNKTLLPLLLAAKEPIFYMGDEAKHMYVLVNGLLEYSIGNEKPLKPSLAPQESVSEAALWMPWLHPGRLMCTSEAELICLNANKFEEVVVQYRDAQEVSIKYAKAFFNFVQSRVTAGYGLTDVLRDEYFYANVLTGMSVRDSRKSWLDDVQVTYRRLWKNIGPHNEDHEYPRFDKKPSQKEGWGSEVSDTQDCFTIARNKEQKDGPVQGSSSPIGSSEISLDPPQNNPASRNHFCLLATEGQEVMKADSATQAKEGGTSL